MGGQCQLELWAAPCLSGGYQVKDCLCVQAAVPASPQGAHWLALTLPLAVIGLSTSFTPLQGLENACNFTTRDSAMLSQPPPS